MVKEYFVHEHSVVRQIWGKSDTILFIFAGAAAEFALNKAVDWLYFTGRLPVDPLGRLFSTVSYARAIVFSEKHAAHRAIDAMTKIHAGVEADRGAKIPDWAYRDVLFMLIDYSIRSFEVLDRKLSVAEKTEVFNVFYRIGERMRIRELPLDFDTWEKKRQEHLLLDLRHSSYTKDLFRQYRKHLGAVRFGILLETQTLVVPSQVRAWLGFRKISLLHPLLVLYKLSRSLKLDWILKALVLPSRYEKEIRALDTVRLAPAH
ncbi:MAG TPA: oxygenase MpaB family protein [Ohtaekwangia sp.]|nr:oxygenase MpaB family protein [Ohtaekwangia sp.]